MAQRETDPSRDERVTSPANPTVKLARSLHRRRVRYRERAVLVEGPRAIRTALDYGSRIRAVLVNDAHIAEIDEQLTSSLREAAGRLLLVDPPLFQQLADTEHPQPLIAICEMPGGKLPADCTFVVALDAVRDPGNLGTLVRSCAAAGADGIVLLHGTADPFGPKAVRSSAGMIFALPVQQYASIDEIIGQCFVSRPHVVAAESAAERAYDELDWSRRSLIVVGGEAAGAGEHARTYADESVRIPMARGVESLNAGVAGSIIAFEVARQRRRRV